MESITRQQRIKRNTLVIIAAILSIIFFIMCTILFLYLSLKNSVWYKTPIDGNELEWSINVVLCTVYWALFIIDIFLVIFEPIVIITTWWIK